MKIGVLQFFSWSRRIPLTTVYERAFSRIDIMLFTEKVLPKLL
jgi:hypothetical protein